MPNRVRFDGRAKRFYEVWYAIFNDPASGDGFWIRYTLLNPLDARPEAGAALWFGYTCRTDPDRSVAVRRVFPRDEFEAPPGSDRVRIGGAALAPGSFSGSFEAEGHAVAWDLRYEASAEPHYYFGPRLRRLAEARTSVTIPNPRIALSGAVTIDGRKLEIRDGLGHQAHHWGVRRSPRWNWGHCCAFEETDAILELLSAEIPGGFTATFVNLHTPEERILCSGFMGLTFNRCTSGLGFWRFEGRQGSRRVLVDVRVDPRYVQKFVYVSPAYRTSECWNTQVGDCLVRVYDGERLTRVLRARGTTAAEVHDEDPRRIPYGGWVSDG